jgi:protein gp37
MGQNSSISWTHHTFNPWWGCQKVSPGCASCYALTLSKRFGHDIWGPAKTTTRRTFGPKHWADPIKWNAEARTNNHRKRVFCASMGDVFEAHPMLDSERVKLWQLIEQTPMLDWLLLTKRPENIMQMIPDVWASGLPVNVWVGTSVEDQQRADERIPELLRVPARVRFLSCEPLLGPVDISIIPDALYEAGMPFSWNKLSDGRGIHWVICGGESGPGARPMHPDWARSLRDQCEAAGVAYHFKQWGEYGQVQHSTPGGKVSLFCAGGTARTVEIVKLGKHAAGRLLDGRTWDQFPA